MSLKMISFSGAFCFFLVYNQEQVFALCTLPANGVRPETFCSPAAFPFRLRAFLLSAKSFDRYCHERMPYSAATRQAKWWPGPEERGVFAAGIGGFCIIGSGPAWSEISGCLKFLLICHV